MKNFFMKHAWAMWMGIGLDAVCDVTFKMWEFYAFSIPLIMLVWIFKEGNRV